MFRSDAQADEGKTPLAIAETKGFVLQHIKLWLRRDGFAETLEGYTEWRKKEKSEGRSEFHASKQSGSRLV